MKNQVIHTRHTSPSSVGYDGECLMISSEAQHTDFEALREQTEAFHRSGTNGYARISLQAMREVKFHSKFSDLVLRFQAPESQKIRKHAFSIENPETREQFCGSLARACGLSKIESRKNPFAKIGLNLFFIFMTGLATYVGFSIANGQLISHRRASVQLVAELLRLIGPEACLVIGAGAGLWFVYRIIHNYLHPTETFIFKL